LYFKDIMDEANLSLEDFLLLEAKERCYEIEIKGLKDFEKEKTRILEQGKDNVREDIEKKLRQVEGQKRIERSSRINNSRLRKMQARNTVILKILDQAEVDLAKKIETDKGFYRDLLKKLIIQSFIKLFEKKVVIKTLERDRGVVEELIPECISEFQAFVKKELELDWHLECEVEKRGYLQLRKLEELEHLHERGVHKSEEDKKCFGGILAYNDDLSIVCKNTVDARLELCFQDSLPPIRHILFPDHH